MAYDTRFGAEAQTPQQRTRVLAQMQAVNPALKMQNNFHAQQLFKRYIAGELCWTEVRQLLDSKDL